MLGIHDPDTGCHPSALRLDVRLLDHPLSQVDPLDLALSACALSRREQHGTAPTRHVEYVVPLLDTSDVYQAPPEVSKGPVGVVLWR
jgi:hypothetical protein